MDCPLDKSHRTLNLIFNKINAFLLAFCAFAFIANH